MPSLSRSRSRAAQVLPAFLGAALLSIGCTRNSPPPDSPTRVYDRSVNEAVHEVLDADAKLPSQHVTVSTHNGIVTLEGAVNDLLAKQRLQALVETVRGVRSVVNLIDVSPEGSLSDGAIRASVERALSQDPVTRRAPIRVSVVEGRVILNGTAGSMAEARLAEHVAQGVAGVRAVEDDLSLDLTQTRTDREIEAEIKARLKYDPWVDEELIAVGVDHGKVRLAGSVGRIAERNRAEAEAWVRGVRAVDTHELSVEPWTQSALRRPREEAWLSPDEIAHAVELSLYYDPRLHTDAIHAHVEGSTVTLTGTAADLRARRVAANDAAATLGVEHVDNHILVRSPPPPDALIAARLKRAIERYPLLDGDPIEVEVNHGTVRLSGLVRSLVERDAADRLAGETAGTSAVENDLSVDPARRELGKRPVGIYPRPSPREDVPDQGMHASPTYSLSLAQCEREERCGFIGGEGGRYPSIENCVSQVIGVHQASLEAFACDPAESPPSFDLCLAAVRTLDCAEPFTDFRKLSACQPDAICRDLL